MKNLIITFYIEMFDKDTKKQEYSIDIFKQHLDAELNCYTLIQCEGHYKHKDGTIVNEPTLKVEFLLENTSSSISHLVEKLKKDFNQECIMVTTQEIFVDFM